MNKFNTFSQLNRKRLFRGICLAVLPTAFSFVLVSNTLSQLKTEFILTNAQVGYIGGAALWGMAISLLIMGPFLEKFGFKRAVQGAFIGHMAGVTLFLAAYLFSGNPNAYWILFLGAIGFGAGNGLIEVAGNPLVAALFPNNKTIKLNHFHAYFPGGMVVGGILGWAMNQIGVIGALNIGHWTIQIGIIYLPIAIYGVMILPERFPNTETAEAGIPFGEMVRYTLSNPLVWGLILLMMVTTSLEMGPSRWIPDMLQAAGMHGILVAVWISGIMMILRMFAAPFVEKLTPIGILLVSSILTGTGLIMFSFIESGTFLIMLAATVFGCGVAFYFPTMVGVMSERFPQTGSLGIVLLAGLGFLAAGSSNGIMGQIADRYLADNLDEQQTVTILEQVEKRFPEYAVKAENASGNQEALVELGYRPADILNVLEKAQKALDYYRTHSELNGNLTGNALRALVDSEVEQEETLIAEAISVLRPADNYGGRMAFLWVGPLAFVVALIFAIIYLNDKKKGGYRVVKLDKEKV